jgi:glycosyltransferase involved in cell wall biosynthesis
MQNPFRRGRPFQWMETVEAKLERAILHQADLVVVTSREYKRDILRTYPDIASDRVHYIPNGFDPEDFENVEPKHFHRFTIVHAGNFYGQRSPGPFLNAVHLWLMKEPRTRKRVQVLFIGSRDPVAASTIEQLGLADIVQQLGPLSHRSTVEHMIGADLLLLIPGPGDGTMPGKAFEYIAARKPILAVAGDGAVRNLIENAGLGKVAYPSDVGDITRRLNEMYQLISTCRFSYPQTSEFYSHFDRRVIAGKISDLLTKLL